LLRLKPGLVGQKYKWSGYFTTRYNYVKFTLTPCNRWRYRCATHEAQRHHRIVRALANSSRHMDGNAPVADGVLVDLSLWGTSVIGLAVQCPDGKYFGSIRVPRDVYDRVLEFLKRNHGRKLREVMDAEIDISDVIQ
jgi:hypothetical protein